MSLPRVGLSSAVLVFALVLGSTESLESQWFGSVSVTPHGGSASAAANSSGNQVSFIVRNTGADPDYFSLSCSRTGAVSGCSPSSSMEYLGADQQTSVTVTYSTGGAGSGTVRLEAFGLDYGGQDNGYYNVTVTSQGVLVTPSNGTTPNRDPYTGGYEATFTVKNEGSAYSTFAISCNGADGVTCPGTDKASVGLGAGAQTNVKAYYSVGEAGDGSLTLTADDGQVDDTGNYTVPVGGEHGVFVGRDGLTVMQERNDNQLKREFFVKNTGNTAATYNLSCSRSGAVSSCTVGSSSVNIDPGVTHVDTVTYSTSTSATGWLRLRAVKSGSSTIRDSAKVTVNTVATNQPLVSVEEAAPGSTHDRSQCLTFSIGPSAAWQCGDLILSHPLPSVRVLGKARSPTLVYNSLSADPHRQIVAAHVTVQSGAVVPDTIVATVKVNGLTRATAKWPGSQWSVGETRRIALAIDAYSDTTGVYPYTLEVASEYGGNSYPTTVSGEYALVNRRYSAFGSGWWLAGLEELLTLSGGDWLWIGSDGSTKRYEQVTSSVWAAEHPSRPDTLKLVNDKYVRFLPHGDSVVFNSFGQHVRTGNRLDHQTTFSYNGDTLTQIALPIEGGTNTYQFDYDGNYKLRTVTGPRGRQTKVYVSSSRTDSIVDPDTTVVKFTHDGSSKRILRRTDRRGTVTSFVYGSVSYRVRDAYINMGSDSIRVFEGWNQLWLGRAGFSDHQSRPLESVYTYIRWPRRYATGGDYSNQWTRFDHNRYGAVTRTRNALAQDTWITRGDAQYAGLVTHVEHPNDWVQHAGYDERGNIIVSTDSSTNATTHYTWDEAWNFVTSVVTPEGDRTDMGYSSSNGNRLWQQDTRGTPSRVTFSYYTSGCVGLVRQVNQPDDPYTPPSEVGYDGMCNVRWVDTPSDYRTWYYKDGIGRDTLVLSPIDASHQQETRTYYDVMSRVDSTVSFGPQMATNIPAQTLRVRNTYDENGNLRTVTRSAQPSAQGTSDLVAEYRYDRANRRVVTIDAGTRDSTVYDAAGNVTKLITARGHTITMSYDKLDRLVERTVPQVDYAQVTCTIASATCPPFPAYPNNGTGLRIAVRADTFTYDNMGNMLTANNGYAQIRRAYYDNGALKSDTLEMPYYSGAASTHEYGLRYTYDLNGRRETMTHSDGAGGTPYVTTYDYTTFGALESVTNHRGHTHRFFYDMVGRVDSTAFPGGYERRTYDYDSRLASRTRVGNVAGELFGETLTRDHRGLVTGAGTLGSQKYTGLGHLAVSHYTSYPLGLAIQDTLNPDALGRQMEPSHYDWNNEPPQRWKHRNSYGSGGRLSSVTGIPADPDQGNDPAWIPDMTNLSYDNGGNLEAKNKESYSLVDVQIGGQMMWAYAIDREKSRFYYGADQKMMFAQVYRDEVDGYGNSDDPYGSFEEYWYDALGRRILKRIRQNDTDLCDRPSWCFTGVERYVWDGDRILHELRATQLDATSPSGDAESQTGRIAYTHGPGIDAPLDIVRNADDYVMIPHSNWRGDYGSGTNTSGVLYDLGINWPAGTMAPFLGADMRELTPWWGSLIQGKRDASGLMYMRNRYYDPSSGQFTQEDPIGLAGGLNLYGFANGDPINFWDPFGLSADSIIGSDEAKQLTQRAINVYRNAQGLNKADQRNVDRLVEEYDEVKNSATDHLYVEIGSCERGGFGCYDADTQTLTVDVGYINQASPETRRPLTTAGHELGHFLDHRRNFGIGGEGLANSMERVLRKTLGWGPKGQPIKP